MNPAVSVPADRLAAFCQANGIARLELFGSALREDFGPDSDIDLLVEFEPDRTPSLLALAGMEIDLSEKFGRKVDLVDRKGVEASRNYIRRESILRTTETIYAA